MPKTRRKRVVAARKSKIRTQDRAESCDTDEKASSSSATPADRSTTTDLSEDAQALVSSVGEGSSAMRLAREFRDICRQHANPSNAAAMKQYMRNQFAFFGIKAPERRQLQKKFTSAHRDDIASRPFLLRFAVALWAQEERECQLYGVGLMSEFRREALGETDAEFVEVVACAEVLITTKSWWDTVDILASHFVGYIVSQRKDKGTALMEQWIASPCLWPRRTALLHQLNFKDKTDAELLFKFCLAVANEEEFFIRKAIGWALRQYSHTNSSAVKGFVEKHGNTLSKLSVREASKYL